MSRKTRKLIWSAPLVAVFAVVGALALFVALAPNGTQAHDLELPGIVTGVTATADGRDMIDVTWKMPADGGAPDYYRIDRSSGPTAGDVWMRLVEMHTGSTSYTDTMGLKPGMPYHYRVFAVNTAGTGPSSDLTASSMATTDGPGRPGVVRMLTGKVIGPNQIDLSWYPPASNGGASITRYCVVTVAGTAALPALTGCEDDTTPHDAAGITTITETGAGGTIVIRAPEGDGKVEFMHKNLPASTARKYEVYAVNSVGVSTAATAVAPVPQTDDPGKPGAPTLRVTVGEDEAVLNAVNLYWTWPADNGGADITTFAVATKVGSGSWTVADADSALPGASQDGVAAQQAGRTITGTTSFRVRATNGTKNSDWSNIVTVRTKPNADNSAQLLANVSPPAVTNLRASIDTSMRQIDLTWTDVSNTSYLIDVRKNVATGRWMTLQSNTGYTRSTYNHRGLDPDTNATNTDDYEYRVFSFKDGAYGPPPADATVTGRTEDIRVGSTSQATKPASVRGLETSSDDPTKITLEWDKPTEDGGQPITGYRVEISAYNGFEERDPRVTISHYSESCTPPLGTTATDDGFCARMVMGADTTMYTVTKLKAGTDRWFRVFAINKVAEDDDGDGTPANAFPDADDIRNAVVRKGTSAKSGTPGMPLDLTVQPARDANISDPAQLGIDILWNAPDNPAGDAVTDYVIARRTKASADAAWSEWDEDWKTIPVSDTDFLRTHETDTDEPDNIANGEMRQYRVKAMSGAGSGPSTAVVTYPVMEGMHDHVMASGTITVDTMTVGDTETVDASMYFTGAMSYAVTSSMPSYATAMVDASTGMVTINAVAAGMSDITVTATDMFGGTDTQMFTVTVEPDNMAPVPGDQLPAAVSLMVGGDDEVITLTGSFTDPDGDTLDYTAAVMPDDGSIATAMVTVDDTDPGAPVSMLTIAAVSGGMATVTVTADDGNGGTAMHEIAVTVTASLTAPSNVRVNPQGSGLVQVEWDTATSAHGYTVVAINVDDLSPTSKVVDGGGAVVTQITLTVGQTYNIYVGSWAPGGLFEINFAEKKRVTVE